MPKTVLKTVDMSCSYQGIVMFNNNWNKLCKIFGVLLHEKPHNIWQSLPKCVWLAVGGMGRTLFFCPRILYFFMCSKSFVFLTELRAWRSNVEWEVKSLRGERVQIHYLPWDVPTVLVAPTWVSWLPSYLCCDL